MTSPTKNNTSLFAPLGLYLVAGVLWFLLFTLHLANFWGEMSLSLALLVTLAWVFQRDLFSWGPLTVRHLVLGVGSFILLYGIFYLGNILTGLLFTFKNTQIAEVYSNKTQAAPWVISVLLLLVIAPGEEIFWRGFLQRRLMQRWGENAGWLVGAVAYGAVHLLTGNVMLVIAALVCGFYWGFLYRQQKSLWPVLISHALWDFTAFVLLPFPTR
ncbi:MAG: CPBP family intramembrane metalloprotease [Spirochaetales bacterium]|nr:CPBP family intramembrane metalloprotease [Spirochaetales bacterium]